MFAGTKTEVQRVILECKDLKYTHFMGVSIICPVGGRTTLPKPKSSSLLVKGSPNGRVRLNSHFCWIIGLLSFTNHDMTSTKEMQQDAETLNEMHGLSVS